VTTAVLPPPATEPRNRPENTVPCTTIVIDGVGVAVPKGQEHLFIEVQRAAQQ